MFEIVISFFIGALSYMIASATLRYIAFSTLFKTTFLSSLIVLKKLRQELEAYERDVRRRLDKTELSWEDRQRFSDILEQSIEELKNRGL